jgi:hypothetical protein
MARRRHSPSVRSLTDLAAVAVALDGFVSLRDCSTDWIFGPASPGRALAAAPAQSREPSRSA